jgi:hypothetical protein
MFQNEKGKQKQSIKKEVKMKNILIGMIFVFVAFCATNAWAITTPVSAPPITVSATVPTETGGLTVTVNKVVGDVWTTASSIGFGTLDLDPVNNIFTPADKGYYAVDIGVADNTGTDWRISHARGSLVRSAGGNIDNKVNVTFVKQTGKTTTAWSEMYTFGESAGKVYTKTQLAGGWLRIYYGIATGQAGKDAANATPIGLDTPAGTYTGSVTITLSP